jgi:hypothetical protein
MERQMAEQLSESDKTVQVTAEEVVEVVEEAEAVAIGHGEKLVPVVEAIRYRKRAQAAEQRAEELDRALQGARSQLGDAQQTIAALERRQKIDALLADAEAIDVEAARLLTEKTIEMMEEKDVAMAVADLRRHKPYLFRQRPTTGTSAMSPKWDSTELHEAEAAAGEAMRSGDRRDLLRYLRMRRKA